MSADMLAFGGRKRSRVRLIRQTEMTECGLAALAMVASFHGLDIDIASLRRRFSPSLRGASLRSLMGIADRIGLVSRAVKLPLENLGDLTMPAILHWDLSHFVVVEAVHRGRALIHNPDGRSGWMPLTQVSNHFTGVALELSPGQNFEAGGERQRLRLSQLWHRLSGMKRALAQVLALSFVLQAFVIASPYYMQIAIDNALPALDIDLLTVLAWGFGLFALINAIATFLRAHVLLIAGTVLGFGLATNIARRLFRLPIDWFEKRHVGDILSRFQSIGPVKQLLTEGAAVGLVDGALAIVTLTVMFFYSVTLTLIAIAAFLLYGVVRAISFSLERAAQEDGIVFAAKEQSTLIESLRGIKTLRLFGRETLRHALWQSRLTDSVNANIRVARIRIGQSTASTLIFSVETVISIWIAIAMVIEGAGFSVGMVFAYIAYKTQFIQKSSGLIDQAIAFKMLGLHLERLSDIALSDEDATFDESNDADTPLNGSIELRQIRYRYAPGEPAVLDGVDLIVKVGEHIAITGPSGGGKSTLVKLLLGLAEPDSGEIRVDGIALQQFGRRSFHRQIAAVMQDDSLFAGTLADNIALFDDQVDPDRVIAAVRAAAIYDDIMRMPMQFETLVGDMGSALSGGQKQRILLARALYRQPRLLVMDEGTAHLDAAHERAVNDAIGKMGITRIIIAHRRETIEAASRVVLMKNGRIYEQPENNDLTIRD